MGILSEYLMGQQGMNELLRKRTPAALPQQGVGISAQEPDFSRQVPPYQMLQSAPAQHESDYYNRFAPPPYPTPQPGEPLNIFTNRRAYEDLLRRGAFR